MAEISQFPAQRRGRPPGPPPPLTGLRRGVAFAEALRRGMPLEVLAEQHGCRPMGVVHEIANACHVLASRHVSIPSHRTDRLTYEPLAGRHWAAETPQDSDRQHVPKPRPKPSRPRLSPDLARLVLETRAEIKRQEEQNA